MESLDPLNPLDPLDLPLSGAHTRAEKVLLFELLCRRHFVVDLLLFCYFSTSACLLIFLLRAARTKLAKVKTLCFMEIEPFLMKLQ